ncbi:hypothetical protein J1G42_02870 [Cellulomonas sp. zg-ZUI222]|uniref:hypothetical protein n=1 Tax=Cellulomonas wangleii TaxID=2816956 RepID=UPI001A950F02|nr:hypothetical protein [Cellulomonas wangleii]MBO0919767.1 hypothetical protein [Cellulomonas wangleii]
MVVRIDPTVLDAVATRVTTLSDELHGMLAEARQLDAGWAVTGLGEVPAWCDDATVDLRARLGIVRSIEQQAVPAFGPAGAGWMEIAGGRTAVVTSMGRLGGLATQPDRNAGLARRPGETLDDWIHRIAGEAIDALPHLDGAGRPVVEAYEWYEDYVAVLFSGGLSALAAATVARVSVTRSVVVPMMQRLALPPSTVENALLRYGTYRAPGTTMQSLLMRMVPLDKMQSVPPSVQRWAANSGLRTLLPAVEARLPGMAKNVYEGVFGAKQYVFSAANAAGEPVIAVRGTSNLLAVAGDAQAGTKLATVARTAGVLRGAGVLGSAASVGFDIAQVASHGNPVEAFRRDGAGYVADIAKTGFDVSLTAALIAPNPVTWGAVAVTGAVYAGAELVDHWDEVSAATSQAAEWTAEQATKAAGWVADQVADIDDVGDVVDKVGGAVEAVADSKINPMNWF